MSGQEHFYKYSLKPVSPTTLTGSNPQSQHLKYPQNLDNFL